MATETKNKVLIILGFIFFILFLVSLAMVAKNAQETYYSLSRETAYLSDANPYTITANFDDVPMYGWEKATLKVYSPVSTRREYTGTSGSFWNQIIQCALLKDPVGLSTRNLALCCRENGYKDVSVVGGGCFRDVGVNPDWVSLKVNGREYWRYDKSNLNFPQVTDDFSTKLDSSCSDSIEKSLRQSGMCSEVPCDCEVDISIESSVSGGTVQIALGEFIAGQPPVVEEPEPIPEPIVEEPEEPVAEEPIPEPIVEEPEEPVAEEPIEEPLLPSEPTPEPELELLLPPEENIPELIIPEDIEEKTEERLEKEKQDDGFNPAWIMLIVSVVGLLLIITFGILINRTEKGGN